MLQFALFVVLSLFELVSLVMLFLLKEQLHAVVSLTAAFFAVSLIFLTLEQPLLALMQLFVMVGGIATYLIVAVASTDAHNHLRINRVLLALLAFGFFAAMYYGASHATFLGTQGSVLSEQAIASSLSQNITMLYVLVFMLFGVGTGTIVLLRRVG